MVNETNFIVRASGRKDKSYYIDYQGVYKVTEIAKVIGLEAPAIKEKYLANGAVYEESLDVFYFTSADSAKSAVQDILRNVKSELKGRIVSLTEAEIEYIRKALINENSNPLHVSNSIKDGIFRKLNR